MNSSLLALIHLYFYSTINSIHVLDVFIFHLKQFVPFILVVLVNVSYRTSAVDSGFLMSLERLIKQLTKSLWCDLTVGR